MLIRSDKFLGSLLFLLTFAVYLATLCPTVYVEGSGELISSIHLLGIAHPTGYPLLCLIGRMIDTIIPFGSVAWRINLTSALLGAAAVAVLYLMLRKLLVSRWAATGSALMFAFSSTFWSQAVIAEVYTLSVLFNVLLLLELLYWSESKERRYLFLFAFTCGLACTNHMTILLMVPAVVLYLLLTLGRDWRLLLHDLPGMIFLFLLGLTPYLYLPIRTSVDPAFQWVPLQTIDDIIGHISGRQYRFHLFDLPLSSALTGLLVFARLAVEEFSPYLLFLPIIGLALVVMKRRKLIALFGGYFLIDLFYGINYHIDYHGIDVFFLPAFLILAIFSGYTLDALCRYTPPRISGRKVFFSSSLWILIVTFFPPLITLVSHLDANDQSENRVADRYGRDILEQLDRGAVLFLEGDDATFVTAYLRIVKGIRSDVALSDRTGVGHVHVGITPPTGRDRVAFERATIERERRPVYYATRINIPDVKGWQLVPAPLCYRMVAVSDSIRRIGDDFWQRCDFRALDRFAMGKDYWTRKLAANYHYSFAEFLLAGGDSSRALEEFRQAGKIAFDSKVVHFNIASYYSIAGWNDAALEELKVALTIDPYFSRAYIRMGQLHARTGRYDDAIRSYESALTIEPESSLVLGGIGRAYAMKGDYSAARRCFERALALNPTNRSLWEEIKSLP